VAATTRWDSERASKIRLLEVRGTLPDQVTCPETKITFARERHGAEKISLRLCGLRHGAGCADHHQGNGQDRADGCLRGARLRA
jgi:hypothetical protein